MRGSGYQYGASSTRSPSFSGVSLSRGPGLSSGELGNSSVYSNSGSRFGAAGNSAAANDLAHIELREEAINKTSILLLEDNKRQIGTLRSEIQNKEAMIHQLEDQNKVLKDTSSYHAAEKEKIIADFKAANQKLANTETELRVKEIMLDRAQKDSSRQRSLLESSIREEQDKNVSLQKSLMEKKQQVNQMGADLNAKRQQLALAESAKNSLQTDVAAKERLISALNSQLNSKDSQIASLTKEKQMIPSLQFENKKLNDDLNRYRMYEDMYKKESVKSQDLESMLRAKENSSKQDAERIASLNSLIASLKDRTDRQEQTINQLQYEKKQLEGELNNAKATASDLENELNNARMNNSNLEARVKDMDDYIKGLDMQIDQLKRENQALNDNNARKQDEIVNKTKVLEDMAQNLGCEPANVGDVQTRVRDLVNTVDNLKQQLTHTQMDAASKGTELMRVKDETDRKIDELTKSLNAANVDKDILNSRVNQLNNEIANNCVPRMELEKTKAELASEQSKSQVLSSGAEKMRNELEMVKNNEESARRNLVQLQKEKELGDSKLAALQQRVDNLELHNSLLSKDNNEKSSRVQRLEDEATSLKNSLTSAKNENSFLNSQNNQLSSKVNELSQRKSYLDSQVKSLESSLQAKEMEKYMMEQEQKAKAEKRFSLLEQRVRGEEELNSAIADIAPSTVNLASSRSSFFSPRLTQSICDEPTGMVSPARVLQASRNMTDDEIASIIGEIDRSMSKQY